MAHAMRNPSSAKHWLDCARYIPFKKAHPEMVSIAGPAAERGTKLHSIVEEMLRGGKVSDETLDAHDLESVESAFKMARQLIESCSPDVKVGLEVPVTLPYEPESKGTIDLMLVDVHQSSATSRPRTKLVVADHKFGKIEVAPWSYQLRIYAASAWRSLHQKGIEVDEIEIAIIQPAVSDDPIVTEIDPGDLGAFMSYVEETIRRQKAGTDRRGASDPATCEYCPFKLPNRATGHNGCPTAKRMLDEAMLTAEEILDGTAADATVDLFYRSKGMLEDALKQAKELISLDAERFPNWKRYERANARTWDPMLEEEEIAHELRKRYDIANPYRLRTVGDIVKEIGKDAEIEDFLSPKRTHTLLRATD